MAAWLRSRCSSEASGFGDTGRDVADRYHRRCPGVEVNRGDSLSVRLRHDPVSGDRNDVTIRKRRTNSGFVVQIGDLVRHDHDLALLSFGRNLYGSQPDVDRTWRRLYHDQCVLDCLVGQSCERADPGFEIGDDDRVGMWNGAEQLLSGQPASRSIRFGIVDSVHDCEPNAVRGIGAIGLEDVIPRVGVVLVVRIDLVAQRQQALCFRIADAERQAEIRVGVTVQADHGVAYASEAASQNGAHRGLARSALANNCDSHGILSVDRQTNTS